MGTSLSGTKIKDTYDGLIKTTNNSAVGSSNVELTDGLGNDINISINNTGALTADGNITGASIIKTGGTATQILLANGTVLTLTPESSGISSNDSDSNVPSNAAVKDYVDTEITNLIDNSPSALNTLNELAAALGDDANFSTTITTALGNRLRIDVSNQGLSSTEKTNALTNLGISSSPTELNILDGATLSTAELNFVDGVTSAIQTQIDNKQDTLTAGTGISISGTTIATDLTNLVGTGAIQADAVTAVKMSQFDDNLTAANSGDILVSNGTDFDNVTMSGDVTIASSGATTIGSGAVETGMLAADAVTGAKVADDAIDSEHLAAGSIDTEHIADSQVTTAKIASDAVNGSKIADDSIDSEHIAAGAIDTEHIGNSQVTDAKLANAKQNVKEAHSASAQTFTVTVATKTSAHRYNGSGSSNGYVIDGVQAPYITITAGNTYKFDQSDSSNTGHPLAFYYESDKTTSYSTGVTTSGTAGSSGAYTQIIATDSTPTVLFYQCTAHSLMGNTVNFDTRNLTGFDTDDLTEGSSNLYFSDERAQDAAASMITGGSHTNLTATYNDGSNTIDLAVSGGGSVSDAFKNIAVSGQSNIVADSATDTLTLAAGSNVTITTDASTDTVTIAASDSVGGISWQSTPKTANFTASAGEGYFVNTTSSAITVTMPSSPSSGDEVHLVDYAGTADTNAITITSSNKINSTTDNYAISYERGGISLVYSDATQGWITYNAANETATALAQEITFDVDYLVVAGAGAGGNHIGGGGGAGGLRTSYGSNSGGGASAESALTVSTLGSYTVTVGAGGSSGTSPSNGTDSTFATITSTGGGRGASRDGAASGTGGSGGGGAAGNTTAGSGTSNQGYGGGTGAGGTQVSNQASGGGGGASAAGTNATAGPNNFTGGQSQSGDGGDGLSVTILSASNATTASVGEVSSSNVYYAGGGGGGDWGSSSATDGDGGLGGGKSYGATTGNEVNGTAGTANTGGGGSGTGYLYGSQSNAANSGGSGVVILRYSNVYSITAGSGLTHQTFVESNDKVTVFTAGTGNISFS